MSEKLSAKILSIFTGSATVRTDIDNDVAVLMPLGVNGDSETDRRNREEIERIKLQLGDRYKHAKVNYVRRIDGRKFRRAA